ncbi:protein LURP-one-related 10-like isoform X2 [Salvia miltiorrhiza]|uniref:protein LURP-one-related 10-like isoform X2 n=1 Tax=Salvia miltiorrhiza TaxID=226208 RepID=UPI0025ABC323|nr:protein LURP-one-related 10-like isoform X2 [Salvia miltiorrhiza]
MKTKDEIAVINPNFSIPLPVDLTITKSIWQIGHGNLVVKNSDGNIMFKIEGSIFSFNGTRVMSDAVGAPIVTLRKKIFSVFDTWKVFRGEGQDKRDLIFIVERASIFQMKTKLAVFLAENKYEDVCDYTVQTSWFERSCQVNVGDSSTKLAQMRKNSWLDRLFSGEDRFEVMVYPNVDCAFIVALIVILDEIVSNSRRSPKHKCNGGGVFSSLFLIVCFFFFFFLKHRQNRDTTFFCFHPTPQRDNLNYYS